MQQVSSAWRLPRFWRSILADISQPSEDAIAAAAPSCQHGCMADHLFADADLAALYDVFCAGRDDFDFYLPLVMQARSVLDVGCGTGALLHAAREAGHTGHLSGLDPAEGMLLQARKRSDIEWVQGDLASAHWQRAFDLIVMTGHAFQVLLTDDELRTSLATIAAALTIDGRFIFETRNPLVRAWESWTPDKVDKITTPTGTVVRMSRQVDVVEADRISFSHTFTCREWSEPRRSQSTLRFLGADALATFLAQAGLAIETQFGDWDRSPLTAASPEIITVAKLA
jgi:SAM-dependent methyltransferase